MVNNVQHNLDVRNCHKHLRELLKIILVNEAYTPWIFKYLVSLKVIQIEEESIPWIHEIY
jgi:hypothetical protein